MGSGMRLGSGGRAFQGPIHIHHLSIYVCMPRVLYRSLGAWMRFFNSIEGRDLGDCIEINGPVHTIGP